MQRLVLIHTNIYSSVDRPFEIFSEADVSFSRYALLKKFECSHSSLHLPL